jgi:quinohemoprotein ethanol dehydrogenase
MSIGVEADAGNRRSDAIADVTPKRLLNIDAEPGAWLTGGRDYQESYYSPLDSINKTNVTKLGFAWQYNLETTFGFEATPIVVDGVMFGSGPKGAVYAVDAMTGQQRWTFEPDIDVSVLSRLCCGPVNRGVAVWRRRVYVASLDGYLYALDASTGAVRWKVDTIIDRGRGYSVTGAPYIAKDLVVIGNSGAEFDARGYITAYEWRTGRQRWRFFTVPGKPEQRFEHPELAMAAKTWDPESLWQVGLGGTVWDGMAYDPKLNLLYFGTGNGGPNPQRLRSPNGGDNLFVSSILAVNPDIGRLAWYYQTTPGDSWDYDAAQKMVLADLLIGGATRSVLMQANKNAFFYVIDRRTGELISADPFVQVNWASHIDLKTGRPVETGQGIYFEKPKLVFPSWWGGHNWQPMAFNPRTGLVYVPAIEAGVIFSTLNEPFVYQRGGDASSLVGTLPIKGPMGLDSAQAKTLPPLEEITKGQPDYKPRSFLRAWDPVGKRVVWEVETSGPWVGGPSAIWNGGGVLTTAAGLVFQGRSTGTLEVLDADNGSVLHEIDVGTGMMAAPMTYMVNGEQYVAIMAGMGGSLGGIAAPGSAAYRYGNHGRIVSFKLGGGAVPHPAERTHGPEDFAIPALARQGSPSSIQEGSILFQRHCAKCHTNTGEGNVPDLRKMSASTHAQVAAIIVNGTRADRGMGNFSGLLSVEQMEKVRDYLISLAWDTYDMAHANPVPE